MRTVSKAGVMNKRLRKGYTTGTCAAAAATAAAQMLFAGAVRDMVEVKLPDGSVKVFELVEQNLGDGVAGCGVIKDAGDDPDVTDGMMIGARARRLIAGDKVPDAGSAGAAVMQAGSEMPGAGEDKRVVVTAAEGIGIATKPGLSVQVGEPAINPVPRKMIEENVAAILPAGERVEVEIFAPEGAERAKKTFNARLGIVGGISILGTTGIVRPMSLASLKASLLPQVDIAVARGYKTVALVPGNMGAKTAQSRLKFPEDATVQMSNFVGDLLEYCAEKGIERVLLLGHIGKMAKVAAGFFDTHSKKTDDAVEILKTLIRRHTRDVAPMTFLLNVNTAEEAALGLSKMGYSGLLDKIAADVTLRAKEYVKERFQGKNVEIGTAITVLSGDIVSSDSNAKRIIREAKW